VQVNPESVPRNSLEEHEGTRLADGTELTADAATPQRPGEGTELSGQPRSHPHAMSGLLGLATALARDAGHSAVGLVVAAGVTSPLVQPRHLPGTIACRHSTAANSRPRRV
jgi:hypothetical protein